MINLALDGLADLPAGTSGCSSACSSKVLFAIEEQIDGIERLHPH
jgi:hypothetical protein